MNSENNCVPSTEPIRCAIYARTGTQTPNGSNSIKQQIEQCKEAARLKGWTVSDTHIRTDSGKSGTTKDGRSGLQELILLATTRPRPFDYVLCASTDRLARNLNTVGVIIGTLTFNGVNLYFASGDLDSANQNFWFGLCCKLRDDEVFSEELEKRILRGELAAVENETAAVPAPSTR